MFLTRKWMCLVIFGHMLRHIFFACAPIGLLILKIALCGNAWILLIPPTKSGIIWFVFGSYVTGHLPRTHPIVADTTHDDRVLEGV